MKINRRILEDYVKEGLLSVQKHPTFPLFIYNYTPECVFEQKWDPITKICRGLVVDENGYVIARPFEKFFNFDEISDPLPDGEPEITKKMDGSLIIVTAFRGVIIFTTRGSFLSEQARNALNIMTCNPEGLIRIVENVGKTFLFEYTGPNNRIVVTYPEDKLTLLAVINNETGAESKEEFSDYFEIVERISLPWTSASIKHLKDLNIPNEEGFVLKWPNGFRVKVKFDDYIELHRILTGLNEKHIWEYMRDRKNIYDLLKKVPEEFEKWVNQTVANLSTEYLKIYDPCNDYFLSLDRSQPRKELAIKILSEKKEFATIIFSLLDSQNERVRNHIYKLIKPKTNKYFKETLKEDL